MKREFKPQSDRKPGKVSPCVGKLDWPTVKQAGGRGERRNSLYSKHPQLPEWPSCVLSGASIPEACRAAFHLFGSGALALAVFFFVLKPLRNVSNQLQINKISAQCGEWFCITRALGKKTARGCVPEKSVVQETA
jgi:hypothetical protein